MTEQSVTQFSDESAGLEPTDPSSPSEVDEPTAESTQVGEPMPEATEVAEPTAEATEVAEPTAEATEVDAAPGDEARADGDAPLDQAVGAPTTDVDPAPAEAVGAEAEVAAVDETAVDPVAEFRAALRSKPGDWYVVHTYSGMEKRVKANLENRITSLNMEDFIYEVHVPQEDVWEVKNGQRKQVSRTVLPGYVLVRMDLTDESWSAVRHTPSVTGFVGHSHQPVPLSLGEVEAMLAPTEEEQKVTQEKAAQKKVEFTDFGEGDSVLIVDGAFATLHATITEINVDAQRVKALVEIFGRETPVELSFTQIQKV